MSILQRQDELLREVGVMDVTHVKVLQVQTGIKHGVTVDDLVEILRNGLLDVTYFQWDPNESIYVTYGSWDTTFSTYRKLHELYVKHRLSTMPTLTGWQIEINLPVDVKPEQLYYALVSTKMDY